MGEPAGRRRNLAIGAGFAWIGTSTAADRIPIRSASASRPGPCTTAVPAPNGLRTLPGDCCTTSVSSWPSNFWPCTVWGLYCPGAK